MRMYVKKQLLMRLKRLQHPCLFLYQDFLIRLHASTSHKYTWACCCIKMLLCPMLHYVPPPMSIHHSTCYLVSIQNHEDSLHKTLSMKLQPSLVKAFWVIPLTYVGSHPRITWSTFGQSTRLPERYYGT